MLISVRGFGPHQSNHPFSDDAFQGSGREFYQGASIATGRNVLQFCMPGLTGGDVVKAYYAAKDSGRRGAAIMSVVFDRLTGTIGLLLLAGGVGLLRLGNPLIRRLTMVIWRGFAMCWLMAIIYF